MFKGRVKGFRGRGGDQDNKVDSIKVPLKKGLFSDGIWQCNCDPRLPAQHFQTKNGGKNHGRWFYTCQKGQPKRCDFFLWDDEAKSREAAAVLNNSRTEPVSSPQTPSKPSSSYIPITPHTSGRLRNGSPEPFTPGKPSKTSYNTPSSSARANGTQGTTTQGSDSGEEEFYDWPASDDDEMSKFADQASSRHPMPPPETPRKAIKADILSTPGKRRYDEMAAGHSLKVTQQTPATGSVGGDIFTTPASVIPAKGLFASGTLPSPAETPTPIRYKDIPPNQESELASEVLGALQSHNLPISSEARETLKGICNKHVLYTRGIMKGRDVSRAIVKSKEKRLVELQGEIEGLKAERETNRAVIRHLRRDMAVRKEPEG